MVRFIWGEIQQRYKYGFSILLTAEDSVRVFGEQFKLSRITAVPQALLCPRPILNLLAQPDKETLSINDITNREITPDSM